MLSPMLFIGGYQTESPSTVRQFYLTIRDNKSMKNSELTSSPIIYCCYYYGKLWRARNFTAEVHKSMLQFILQWNIFFFFFITLDPVAKNFIAEEVHSKRNFRRLISPKRTMYWQRSWAKMVLMDYQTSGRKSRDTFLYSIIINIH
jgi:hypothetical protein